MQTVVTAEQMRWCDERTIAMGVPGLLLMENAGRSVVDLLHEQFGPMQGAHVVVICGKGNNGGDGFVIARHLCVSGVHVSVLMTAAPQEYRGDAKTNLSILREFARDGRNRLQIRRASPSALRSLAEPDLVIDALFGTGFAGVPRRPQRFLIDWMNQQTAAVVAVDVPSGADATTGRCVGASVDASMTVTFGLLKSGLLLNEAREASGRVYVADIGIPPSVVDQGKFRTWLSEQEDVRPLLPRRPFNANKYTTGKVLIIAGSRGFTGAASLAATAALRSGAGAVMLLTPESVYPVLARKLNEAIVRPLPCADDGAVNTQALDVIRTHLDWADVVLLGPGLSLQGNVTAVVSAILGEYHGNLVLDADALSVVASAGASLLKRSKAKISLTPHSGEFARLTGMGPRDIETDRVESVRAYARATRSAVILKGVPTATASSDGTVILNSTGNPGMATVGSGDVLAGIVAGLWAQGMEQHAAAWCAAFVHGLSGDIAAERMGERSLVAGDLIEYLPKAFARIETGRHE